MLNTLLSRWKRSALPWPDAQSTLPSAGAVPALSQRGPDSLLQSLLRWLPAETDPWQTPDKAADRLALLPQARQEFLACLDGLRHAETLARSIQHAASLRELWHLRSNLYTAVASQINQWEAEQRLQRLAACFPPGQGAAAARQRGRLHA